MRGLRFAALWLIAACCGSAAVAQDFVFEGPWRTTNRKLDGMMTCHVKQVAEEKWEGRFFGVWQGVDFDYTVAFAGPPSDLRGTATIDGAHYDWTGKIESGSVAEGANRFQGTFGGSRYAGFFDLKAKPRGRER